jgi:hypothetical protein
MATQARVARQASEIGRHVATPERRVFTSRLSVGETFPALTPTVGGSRARGTVKLVVNDDDSFEYLATIYNPDGEAFTGAFLKREAADSDGEVVATLFSDVTLRSRYIQLRGTVSLARDVRAEQVAEGLREHPQGYAIDVHASSSPTRVAIHGVVQ